jgi:hypothetical protein
MSFEQIVLVPGFDGLSFNQALALLAPYSPRLAFNFEQPAGNLWTDTARTTPVTTLGQSIAGITNRVTGATVHAAQGTGTKCPIWSSFTAASGKTVYGARADGTDDSWQVASFDLSDTDEVTIIGGFRKLSDAAAGGMFEHTANFGSVAGSFYCWSQDLTSEYASGARGTAAAVTSQVANTTSATYNAPHSVSLATTHDISGDLSKLWLNNVAVTSGAGDKGAGNFANSTFNIGQRNAATQPFNGWYAPWLFVCGNIVPDAIHQKIARAMAKKLGLSI